jgi:hypothetical protein
VCRPGRWARQQIGDALAPLVVPTTELFGAERLVFCSSFPMDKSIADRPMRLRRRPADDHRRQRPHGPVTHRHRHLLHRERPDRPGDPAFARKGSTLPCDPFWDAAWTLEGDQLRMVDVKADESYPLLEEAIFASRPFTKIG